MRAIASLLFSSEQEAASLDPEDRHPVEYGPVSSPDVLVEKQEPSEPSPS